MSNEDYLAAWKKHLRERQGLPVAGTTLQETDEFFQSAKLAMTKDHEFVKKDLSMKDVDDVRSMFDRINAGDAEVARLNEELALIKKLLIVWLSREGGEIALTEAERQVAAAGGDVIYDEEEDAAGFTRLHLIPDFVARGDDVENDVPAEGGYIPPEGYQRVYPSHVPPGYMTHKAEWTIGVDPARQADASIFGATSKTYATGTGDAKKPARGALSSRLGSIGFRSKKEK